MNRIPVFLLLVAICVPVSISGAADPGDRSPGVSGIPAGPGRPQSLTGEDSIGYATGIPLDMRLLSGHESSVSEPGRKVVLYTGTGGSAVEAAVAEMNRALRAASLGFQRLPLRNFFRNPPSGHPGGLFVVAALPGETGPFAAGLAVSGFPVDSFRLEYLSPGNLAVSAGTPRGLASGILVLTDLLRGEDGIPTVPEGVRTPRFAVRAVELPPAILDSDNAHWALEPEYWRSLFGQLVTDRWNAVVLPPERFQIGDHWQEVSQSVVQAAAEFGFEIILDVPSETDSRSGDRISEVIDRARTAGGKVAFRGMYRPPGTTSGPITALHQDHVRDDTPLYIQVPENVPLGTVAADRKRTWKGPVFLWLPEGAEPTKWKKSFDDEENVAGVVGTLPPNPYHLIPWGDPAVVTGTLERMEEAGVSGVCLEVDPWLLGIDDIGTEYYREKCQSWEYRHEKNWFRFRLWGMSAFGPEPRRETLEGLFTERHGESRGAAALDSRIAASRILQSLIDLFPELGGPGKFLEGAWPGSVSPRRDPGFGFIPPTLLSADRLRDLEATPGTGIGVPEMVGMELAELRVHWNRTTNPLELSETLAELAHDARASARVAFQRSSTPPDLNLARAFDLETQFMANLARFYAWQLETAVRGTASRAFGDPDRRRGAENSAREARKAWRDVVTLADYLYQPLDSGGGGFHWNGLSGLVEKQIGWVAAPQIALASRPVTWEVIGPFPLETRHMEAFEKTLSATAEGSTRGPFLLPSGQLEWQKIEVRVLEATPPAELPSWVQRVNTWARFVNFSRVFEREYDAVAYARRGIQVDMASDATLFFPLERPDRVWFNGETIYSRDRDGETFPEEGFALQFHEGVNEIIFGVDRRDGKPVQWGAAPHLVWLEGGPEAGGPEAGGPEAGGPEAGGPEAGDPEAGGPEAGDPEAGDPEAGDVEAEGP